VFQFGPPNHKLSVPVVLFIWAVDPPTVAAQVRLLCLLVLLLVVLAALSPSV